MNVTGLRRWLFFRSLEVVFFSFVGLLRILPLPVFRKVTGPTFKLLIYLVIPRRRITRNLAGAFGETYSPSTKRGLAKGVQEHFAKNLVDCCSQIARPEQLAEIVTIRGIENLGAALAKGRGVIALGAHIGNFVLLGARLGLEGYPFHTLFRIPADQRMRRVLDRYLSYFYQQIIPSTPRRAAARRILEVLKRNEIVFILGDNLKRGKVPTRLFGQSVRSPRGPVSLALRSGASVLPVYLVRDYHGELVLTIEPEIVMIRNGTLADDIAHNTHRIAHYLEGLIRRYPDQWNWLTVRLRKNRTRQIPTPDPSGNSSNNRVDYTSTQMQTKPLLPNRFWGTPP